MTQEEKTQKQAYIIKALTDIDPFKSVMDLSVVGLYDLIKLAVDRKGEDY